MHLKVRSIQSGYEAFRSEIYKKKFDTEDINTDLHRLKMLIQTIWPQVEEHNYTWKIWSIIGIAVLIILYEVYRFPTPYYPLYSEKERTSYKSFKVPLGPITVPRTFKTWITNYQLLL